MSKNYKIVVGEEPVYEATLYEGDMKILSWTVPYCTSSKDMAPIGPFSKRQFSAGCFSSLAC